MSTNTLFHYTDYHGLQGIVSSRSIWCTKIQYLNDSSELLNGLNILKSALLDSNKYSQESIEMDSIIERLSEVNIFTCSFSENGDLLSQWRGYAARGGVSIEFDPEELREKAGAVCCALEKCVYDFAEQKRLAEDFIKNFQTDPSSENPIMHMFFEFLPIAARFKHDGFKEEKEWRLISSPVDITYNQINVRASTNSLVPYIDFDLKKGETEQRDVDTEISEVTCIKKVVIGPSKLQKLQSWPVLTLFKQHNVKLDFVSTSLVPYREL